MKNLTEKQQRFFNMNTDLHRACLSPPMAYTYFPQGREIIEFDPKEPKKTLRRIFEGGTEYNSFELENLHQLKVEIEKYNAKQEKKKKHDKILIFPNTWKEYNSLRFLQARSYDYDKTIDIIKEHIVWRKENIPLRMTDKSIEILNDLGLVYYYGRDCKFRPTMCIVARVYMQNCDNYAYDNWVTAFIYLLEYAINNLLLPGQVENWNIICDLADVSVITLPSDFKKIFSTLQCNYRCRLYVMYLLNMSSFIVFLWGVIKVMLDPTTERKLKILGEDRSEMFRFLNPDMIEKKFGGTAENVTKNFFPPMIPSQNFLKPTDDPKTLFVDNKSYLDIMDKNQGYAKSPYIKKEVPKPVHYHHSKNRNTTESHKETHKHHTHHDKTGKKDTIKSDKNLTPVEEGKEGAEKSDKTAEEKTVGESKDIILKAFGGKYTSSKDTVPVSDGKSTNSETAMKGLASNLLHKGIKKLVYKRPERQERGPSPNQSNADFTNLNASVDTEFTQKTNLLKKKQCVEVARHKRIGPNVHFKDLAKLSSQNRSINQHNEDEDVSKLYFNRNNDPGTNDKEININSNYNFPYHSNNANNELFAMSKSPTSEVGDIDTSMPAKSGLEVAIMPDSIGIIPNVYFVPDNQEDKEDKTLYENQKSERNSAHYSCAGNLCIIF